MTSTRLIVRAVCWTLAILIGLPALALQLAAWAGGIVLLENYILWAVSTSLGFGYAGQKVAEPRPQILTVRSDKELDSLKEGLATVKEGLATVQAEVHNIMEILRMWGAAVAADPSDPGADDDAAVKRPSTETLQAARRLARRTVAQAAAEDKFEDTI